MKIQVYITLCNHKLYVQPLIMSFLLVICGVSRIALGLPQLCVTLTYNTFSFTRAVAYTLIIFLQCGS